MDLETGHKMRNSFYSTCEYCGGYVEAKRGCIHRDRGRYLMLHEKCKETYKDRAVGKPLEMSRENGKNDNNQARARTVQKDNNLREWPLGRARV